MLLYASVKVGFRRSADCKQFNGCQYLHFLVDSTEHRWKTR